MITQKNIDALKHLIVGSKDPASDTTKRILLFLLNQSELLRKPVCVSIIEGKDGFSKEDSYGLFHGVDNINSSNGATMLNVVMKAMDCDFSFFVHSGTYHFGEFKELQNTLSYTVWLSNNRYDNEAKRLSVTRQELENIPLVSELYKSEKF